MTKKQLQEKLEGVSWEAKRRRLQGEIVMYWEIEEGSDTQRKYRMMGLRQETHKWENDLVK